MCGCSTNVEQEKGCPYPALATPQLRMDHPCQRHAGTKTCRNKRQKGVLSDFIAYNRTAGLKCLVRYIYVYKVYEGAGSCTSPLYKYLAKKIAYNRTAGLKCLVRYIYIYMSIRYMRGQGHVPLLFINIWRSLSAWPWIVIWIL